ncbi:hypothetical protein PFLA_a4058 [Pseudoalteromonas flavipulchra NCIMB 2033 = ATCC BAA-314]|nr:hypothetical protein [Pseudoalteromonas flavipulchra NCIMB 2033 = ATCC BAA-314]
MLHSLTLFEQLKTLNLSSSVAFRFSSQVHIFSQYLHFIFASQKAG